MLLEEECGFAIGVEFHFVAFQNVMAALLDGDTLHTAFNMGFGRSAESSDDDPFKRQALRLRWVVIDEISMVSAQMLAQVDLRLRELVGAHGPRKLGPDKAARPFGGLNVIFAGDFWQLPPVEGASLATIPDQILPQAKTLKEDVLRESGLELFWDRGPQAGVQGLTELQRHPHFTRCKDDWYLEVLDECRRGALSRDTHAFLHGEPTSVPGTYLNGAPTCGVPYCATLVGRPPPIVFAEECPACALERRARRRVATGPDDIELTSTTFRDAPIILRTMTCAAIPKSSAPLRSDRATRCPQWWPQPGTRPPPPP